MGRFMGHWESDGLIHLVMRAEGCMVRCNGKQMQLLSLEDAYAFARGNCSTSDMSGTSNFPSHMYFNILAQVLRWITL